MGGVLFIDEAYYLYRAENERDYGQESIEILLQVMEARRDDLVVVLAGYSDKMDVFFQSNPGISSRIAHHVEFPDYTLDELVEIALRMLGEQRYELTPDAVPRSGTTSSAGCAGRASPTRAVCATRWSGRGCVRRTGW